MNTINNSSGNNILSKSFHIFDFSGNYLILCILKNNAIYIKGKYENDSFSIEYDKTYNLIEMKNLSDFFNQCNSIRECFDKINNINEKKCKVEKNGDKLIFIINIENQEIRFELNYNNQNIGALLNCLFDLYSNNKMKMDFFLENIHLEESIKKMSDEIYQLKTKIKEYESKENKNIEKKVIDLEKITVEEVPEVMNDSKDITKDINPINEIKGITGSNFIKLKNNNIAMYNYGKLIIVDNKLNILLKREISKRGFHSMTKMQVDNCLLASTWGNRIFIIKLSNSHRNLKIVKVLEGELDTEPGEGNRNEGIYYAVQLSNGKIISSDNKHLLIWDEKYFSQIKKIKTSGVYYILQIDKKYCAVAKYWERKIEIYSIDDFSVTFEINDFVTNTTLYPYKFILIDDEYYIVTGFGGGEESIYLLSIQMHKILDRFTQLKGWCKTFCVLPNRSFILFNSDFHGNYELVKIMIINNKFELMTRKKINERISGLSYVSPGMLIVGEDSTSSIKIIKSL